MNSDYDNEIEAGLSRNAKRAIGIGTAIVLVGVAVGAVLLIRSRASIGGSGAVSQSGSHAVNASASAEANLTNEEKQLKAAQDYFKSHMAKVDDSKIQYGVELQMTADEMKLLGYGPAADVRYKYVKGGLDPINNPVPVRIITKAPTATPPTVSPQPKKKSAPATAPITAPATNP